MKQSSIENKIEYLNALHSWDKFCFIKLLFVFLICIMKCIYVCTELGYAMYFSLGLYFKNLGSFPICLALWSFVYRLPSDDGEIALVKEMSREVGQRGLGMGGSMGKESSLESMIHHGNTVFSFTFSGCRRICMCCLELWQPQKSLM